MKSAYFTIFHWSSVRTNQRALLLAAGLTFWVQAGASLPDFGGLLVPTPEPVAPAEWDVFSPPVTNVAPATNAPSGAEWTRTAAPNDSIVVSGADLGRGLGAGTEPEFVVFGQTVPTNGTKTLAAIQFVDGDRAAITLPRTLPTNSMFLLWPINGVGSGRPMAVNRTDAWWLGFSANVAPGDTVSAYGRNLASFANRRRAWVYLVRAGTGTWAPIVSVNPYRVQFTVPPSFVPGTYEVWLHNGHGGRYGWSGPLALEVATPSAWNGTQFNVRDYGAKGDGTTDDTSAINLTRDAAAFFAAHNPGKKPTVYFPAGVYQVRSAISLSSNIRYMGAGMDSSIIRCGPLFKDSDAGAKLGLLLVNGGVARNIEVTDLTLDANGQFAGSDHLIRFQTDRGTSDIKFRSVRIKAIQPGLGAAIFVSVTRLTLENCDFLGGHVMLFQGKQQAINRCRFFGAYDNGQAIIQRGVSELSVTDCYHADLDSGSSTGQGSGRFIAGNSDYGSQRHVYIGGNVTVNCGPRVGAQDSNSGEHVMCEGNITDFTGTPSTATATTITLPRLSGATVGETVVISHGRGAGQYREIKSYDTTSKTITLSSPWNVIPDATSTVMVALAATRWVIYNNQFDGKDDYASRYTAMAAIQPYGGSHDWIGDSNTISNMFTGIYVAALEQEQNGSQVQPSFFNYFVNNTFISCKNGIRLISGASNKVVGAGSGLLGTTIRRNGLKGMNVVGVGFETAAAGAGMVDINSTVIEHNQFKDLPVAIELTGTRNDALVRNTVVYSNTFERGTAASAGSVGVNLGKSSERSVFVANVWSGFGREIAGAGSFKRLAELPLIAKDDPDNTEPSSSAPTPAADGLPSLLRNLSARAYVEQDNPTQIIGFSITGAKPRSILIRASGPALAGLGVPDTLADPQLTLYSGQTVLLSNDDWETGSTSTSSISAAAARVGAFPWAAGSRDAATLVQLAPGNYSVHVSGKDGGAGITLIEVYDDGDPAAGSRLCNLSAMAWSGDQDRLLIAGFVISGTEPKKVLVRANGPSLKKFAVQRPMADPILTVYSGTTAVAQNDDWEVQRANAPKVKEAAQSAGAFEWDAASKDAAIVLTLAPGVYSAHVNANGNAPGRALVEIYELP